MIGTVLAAGQAAGAIELRDATEAGDREPTFACMATCARCGCDLSLGEWLRQLRIANRTADPGDRADCRTTVPVPRWLCRNCRETLDRWIGRVDQIPREEAELLKDTVREAWALAEAGLVAQGRVLLSQGLAAAEPSPGRQAEWLLPLAAKWREALEDYVRQWMPGS